MEIDIIYKSGIQTNTFLQYCDHCAAPDWLMEKFSSTATGGGCFEWFWDKWVDSNSEFRLMHRG
jgi:hypothetical protein